MLKSKAIVQVFRATFANSPHFAKKTCTFERLSLSLRKTVGFECTFARLCDVLTDPGKTSVTVKE